MPHTTPLEIILKPPSPVIVPPLFAENNEIPLAVVVINCGNCEVVLAELTIQFVPFHVKLSPTLVPLGIFESTYCFVVAS